MRNETRERGSEIREEEGSANKKSQRNWKPHWKRKSAEVRGTKKGK